MNLNLTKTDFIAKTQCCDAEAMQAKDHGEDNKNTLTRQGNVVKDFVILKFEEENIEIKS